jgi:glycine/D-amino acid oxidase-like deaminating enzyme
MHQGIPAHTPYLIIGAGVHGLSTAYHLARELRTRGQGSGRDVVVLDKAEPGAGASGIACGVVRNNYSQPAMGRVMRESVSVWETHSEALSYHPVGYLAAAPEAQADDLEAVAERHAANGYRATLVRGERRVRSYLRELFPDWRASGLAALLHEHQGGFADSAAAVAGLVGLAEAEGVTVVPHTAVTGFRIPDDEVSAVYTDRGTVEMDQVVVGAGPWIERLWSELGLPASVDVATPEGEVRPEQPMWTYWQVCEGEAHIPPTRFVTAAGDTPPVLHVDSAQPLHSDRDGRLLTDEPWGIYFKQDPAGVQGGGVPRRIGEHAQVDPYGPASPYYTVDDDFADYWTAGLAHCLGRFSGISASYDSSPSGGIGAFSADSFPVFDYMRPNAYVIADSNHGFKMIGVGKEVAKTLLGEKSETLFPFRFSRYAEGDLHPASNSPFPWS